MKKTTLSILTILISVFPVNDCASLGEANPKAFFQPKLQYRELASTKISILSLAPRKSPLQMNNPFFGFSAFSIANHVANPDYHIKYNNITYHPRSNGKILLRKTSENENHIELFSGSQSKKLKIMGELGKTTLVCSILTEPKHSSQLPPIVTGQMNMEKVENLGFQKLVRLVLHIQKQLRYFAKGSSKFNTKVSEDYRDNIGKSKDFESYLKILSKSIVDLSIKNLHIEVLEKEMTRVSLTGTVQTQKIGTTNFELEIILNKDKEIVRVDKK
jgi:hypothetical protein